MTLMVCACVTGCSLLFLSPAPDTSRHFVLISLPPTETANVGSGTSRVDVVHVKIPSYLFNSSLAVRRGTNEIVYPPGTLWAERLNTGIPRVLAADLSSLLPSEQIRLAVGSSEDIVREIDVTIEQFDVSFSGQAVLVAKWRIFSPGGEKTSALGRKSPLAQWPGARHRPLRCRRHLERPDRRSLPPASAGSQWHLTRCGGEASSGHEIPRHRRTRLLGYLGHAMLRRPIAPAAATGQ